MGLHGEDWSSYQSATPATAGLSFAFVKLTEGLGYVNPRWKAQRDHAKAAGLVWGAYHYPHMANDPRQEADYFLSQVAWQPGDVLVLDWEGYDPANKTVSKARQLAYRDAWLAYVKAKMPTHQVGMYCNTDYWLHVDTSGNCGDFLWIATGGTPAGQPGINHPWMFHQYSTAGGTDHDYCPLPTIGALRSWALAHEPQQEDPMAVSDADAKKIALAVWQTDFMPPPAGAATKDNPTWWPQSVLLDAANNARAIRAAEAAQTAAITALAKLIGSGVDTTTVVDAVQKAIADAVVHVQVDVTDQTKGV